MIVTHNDLSEAVELFTLEWFGEVIGDHAISWALLNVQLSLFDSISNPEVFDVDVA